MGKWGKPPRVRGSPCRHGIFGMKVEGRFLVDRHKKTQRKVKKVFSSFITNIQEFRNSNCYNYIFYQNSMAVEPIRESKLMHIQRKSYWIRTVGVSKLDPAGHGSHNVYQSSCCICSLNCDLWKVFHIC